MHNSGYKVFNETAEGEKAKKLQAAIASCKNVLKTSPNDFTTMHALGLIECHLGHIAEGLMWFEKALNINPVNADILYHHGLALMEVQQWDKAAEDFRATLDIQPGSAEALYHLGVVLNESGKVVEAQTAYQQAIAINPNYAEALNNLGNIHNNKDEFAEAIDCYRRAMKAQPTYVMPYNNMGLTLVNLGKLDDAEQHYRHAIGMKPDYAEAYNNLGIIYRMRGDFEESKLCTQKALSLRAEYPEALNNLANAYKDLGDMTTAIEFYERALRLHDTPDYRHNMALALLAAGRLQEGFKEYEWRWTTKQLAGSARHFPVPQWKGEAGEGRTLLITSEQGFGDSLQFCRYASMAAERGLRVFIEVPAALKKIISSLKGVEQVIARGEALPKFDLYCPMMSLPHAFATSVETIPAPVPYLYADETGVEVWKNRLGPRTKKLRVGLVWAGSSRMYSQDLVATDRRRSLAPEMMAPLFAIPDIEFYSLQKTGEAMPPEYAIMDHMNLCHDFADTAALVANLGLVISVDTAMAHLVGALGKPVWMLNRFDSCWRWLQNRDDSPWYPTLRQFRQTKAGDWHSVISRVRVELEKFIAPKC